MRSPLGALTSLINKTPVPYVPSTLNLAMPWSHKGQMEQQMRAMGSVGTLFAIVHRTSTSVAQVEWKLWRKAASGLEEDRTEVVRHAALDLWNKPNPFMTGEVFRESFQQHLDLTGEGWWVIARNGRSRLPLEIWPVRPDRMEPIPHPTEYLTRYEYRGPGGEKVPLEREDVVFLRTPHPLDTYRGMGPVQSLLADLDATKYSAEWNRNFFVNGAEPGGIIEIPDSLGDADFQQMRDRWNEQHKGVANAHRVALIEHGKWVDRKYTQRDMQFTELRNVSREVIREAFGMPKPMLGTVDDANRANMETAEIIFARYLMVPRLERIKAALNETLLPLYGATGLEFDYVNPVPEDREAEARDLTAKSGAAAQLVTAGYDAADVLGAVGLPEMRYAPPQPALAQEPPARPVTGRPAARARSHRLRGQGGPDGGLEDVREAHTAALEALLTAWEEQVLPDQYQQIEDQVKAAVDAEDPEALADLTVDYHVGTARLRRALADMARTGAEQMADEAAAQGVQVDPPDVDAGLSNRTLRVWAAFGGELVEIASATAALLASGLASSAAREAVRLFSPGVDGMGVAERVGRFVRGLSDRFRRDQLGGALHRAQNAGRLAVLEEAPTARYFASEVNDTNRCGPCAAVDGTEFADLTEARETYAAGGYPACEGGIRCRGTVVAVWE